MWVYDAHFRPRWPTGPSVRVATWNLRQFSERESIDFDSIADVIRDNEFDLVAIQEVRGDGGAVDLLASALNGFASRRWRVVMSERTGNYERFAFLYDSDTVEHLGDSGFLPARLDLDRRPFAGQFKSGNFDFTLVTIHLRYDDVDRRRREATDLAAAATGSVIPAGSGERDVIILGDFNTTRRVGGTLTPFESRGWLALNDEPTNLGDSEILDNLVIQPDATREWSGISGVVRFDDGRFDSDEAAARSVSDHRPVWADFVVNGEDDD